MPLEKVGNSTSAKIPLLGNEKDPNRDDPQSALERDSAVEVELAN
jgi:hypothetical protein